nr:unnamed protein product [Callosobruchus chinensis]
MSVYTFCLLFELIPGLSIFLIINAVISIVISVVWLCRKKKRSLKFHKSDHTDATKTKRLELKNGGIFITKMLHHFENIPGRSEQDLQDTAANDASKRFVEISDTYPVH